VAGRSASTHSGFFDAQAPQASTAAVRLPCRRAFVAATWRATSQSAVTVAARYSGREYNTLTNTDTNPNTYGGTSTYTVVDAKFTFRPTKRTELGIGVDNLFDHRYYVFHPYAGRTVYVEGRIGI